MKEICGAVLPLIRLSRDEATRFALCRLPVDHDGWHNENEGLHPVSWIDNPDGTQATGVAAELRARRASIQEGVTS